MKVEKKFSWKAMLVLTFVLTAMFSMSVFASTTAPSKVTGLKQTSASTTAVDIAWDSVLGSDIYYEVEYSTDATYWVQYEDCAYNANDYIYDLSSGKSYYVRVRAYSKTYNYDTYQYDVVTGEWSDALEVVTKPQLSVASYGSITQTAATKNSITIKWPATTGASYYDVYVEDVKVGSSYTTTYTVKGLAASSKYDVDVYPVRRSATGYVATGYSMYDFNYATAPGKVANVIASASQLTECKLDWSAVTNADGYEIWLYKYNGKKPVKKLTKTYNWAYIDNLKRNLFYKVKVRAYVNVGTQKVYGEWSKLTEFAQPPIAKVDVTSGVKKIKVTYKKVKGAENYTIYLSTKEKSGFKKIATTKKTKYVIKKFKKKSLKLNKRYYVMVVANRKSGKKTIKSCGITGGITTLR